MGKPWPNREARKYLYTYVCGRIYAFCLSYFSNCPSRIGKKLNWKVTQAVEKPYTIGILSYRVIIYPATIHINCLCFGYHNQEQSDIWGTKWRSSLQRGRGTQQENSATKNHIGALVSCGFKRIRCISRIKVKAIGNGDNVTGTGMGRRAQETGMSLRWGSWQGASLPGTCV